MNNESVSRELASSCGEPGFIECHVAVWIWKTVPFIQLVAGTVGNTLSLIILSRMPKRTTTVLLICLACSDLVFLFTALLRSALLYSIGFDMKSLSIFNCKVHEWLALWAASLSNWLLVTLTVERSILITFPFISKQTMRKGFVVCIYVVFSVTGLISSHFVIGNHLENVATNVTTLNGTMESVTKYVCLPSTINYKIFMSHIWPKFVMIGFAVIPFVLILFGNIIIMTKILKRSRLRQSNVNVQENEKVSRATRLLLLLSAMLFVCMIPYTTVNVIYQSAGNGVTDEKFAKFQLAYAVVVQFVTANSTCNFYLYVLNGPVFRRELVAFYQELKTYMSSTT